MMKERDIENISAHVADWLGEENLRWFRHLKGLFGRYDPVIMLNMKRRGLPYHAVHLREGMQIRNFMRGLEECKTWNDKDFDKYWTIVIEMATKRESNAKD